MDVAYSIVHANGRRKRRKMINVLTDAGIVSMENAIRQYESESFQQRGEAS